MYVFGEHFQTITGLSLARVGTEVKHTYLLSTSIDSNMKMWNMDDGNCLNRITTTEEINGVSWLPNGNIYTFSNEKVSVWALSKCFTTFAQLGSPLVNLKRLKLGPLPSKILGYGSNGSVIFMSPRTGEKLIIAYPSPKESTIIDMVYDPYNSQLYLLDISGSMDILDASFNPCVFLRTWTYHAYEEKVVCAAGLCIQKDILEKVFADGEYVHYYLLLCGTNTGQIVFRDVLDNGSQHLIVQVII